MLNGRIAARLAEVTIVCFVLAACGGGGGGSSPPPSNPPSQNPPPPAPPQLPDPASAPALKTEFSGFFGIGAAIEPEQLDEAADTALLSKHYSNLTPENAMKADTIAPLNPSEGNPYQFDRAERIVDFAMTNGMKVHGHALVWHQTTPEWFLKRPEGMNDVDYRATIEQRLRDYVTTVVDHFEGRVEAWDVVNEVASDGPEVYRNSQWYQAFSVGGGDGQQYIRIAFQAARAADPNALLFINDYSTEDPAKLAKVLEIVDYIEASGEATVDGVGHQFHLQRSSQAAHIDAALTTVADRGKANRVTELDISIYADPGSCFVNGTGCQADYGINFANIPQSVVSAHARLYRELFAVFKDHSNSTLQLVTTWGVHDAHTWLNSWPVNRTNRPLLFDRDRNPKLAFWAVVDPTFTIP